MSNLSDNILFGVCTLFCVLLFSMCATIASLMFQYTLFTFTGKDIHFMLDLLGGIVLNGLNLPLFVFSLTVS